MERLRRKEYLSEKEAALLFSLPASTLKTKLVCATPEALAELPKEFKTPELCLAAVQQFDLSDEEMLDTLEGCLTAIQRCPDRFLWCRKNSKHRHYAILPFIWKSGRLSICWINIKRRKCASPPLRNMVEHLNTYQTK